MSTLAPQDELRLLLHDTALPDCTSRSQHRCTKVATRGCRGSNPCPDPAKVVYWCDGRYTMHMQRQGDCICSWCKRLTIDCWIVWPL